MSSLSPLAQFFRNVRSQNGLKRDCLPQPFSLYVQQLEHDDFSSVDRSCLCIVAKILLLSKKEKVQFFNLLNQSFPKKFKRVKFDSKRKRRAHYKGRFS